MVHAPRFGDPVMLKTHFPFVTLDNRDELLASGTSDAGAAVFLILPARYACARMLCHDVRWCQLWRGCSPTLVLSIDVALFLS
jgi:hypothetical protein